MYFTREDYKKIEEWLSKRTLRDTEFPSTDCLDGSEKFAIIQNGENKLIRMKCFIAGLEQLFDTGIEDLEEAIELKKYINGAEYSSYEGYDNAIVFKHDEEVVAAIDVSDFILDKAVKDVRINEEGTHLLIEFNVDAGSKLISIPLVDIFNPKNYYTVEEIDGLLKKINSNVGDIEKKTNTLDTKLKGIESGAQVNTNSLSTVSVGNKQVSLTNKENLGFNIDSTTGAPISISIMDAAPSATITIGTSPAYKKNEPNGIPSLGVDGKIPVNLLPTNYGGGTSAPAFTGIITRDGKIEASEYPEVTFDSGTGIKVHSPKNGYIVFDLEETYQKGKNNGVAPLDSNGKVSSTYLPDNPFTFKTIIAETGDTQTRITATSENDEVTFSVTTGLILKLQKVGEPKKITFGLSPDYIKGQNGGVAPLDEGGRVPRKHICKYGFYELHELQSRQGISGDFDDIIEINDYIEDFTISINDEGWSLGMSKTLYIFGNSKTSQEVSISTQDTLYSNIKDLESLSVNSEAGLKCSICKGAKGFYAEFQRLERGNL